jgi:hypothetical protein
MRKLFVLTFTILVLTILAACTESVNAANARITMDINPSVEIITNARGRVESVTPLNDDAQTLLLDTNFKGKIATDVVVEIAELARQYGYLKAGVENALVVTTETDDPAQMNRIQAHIRSRIQAHLQQKNITVNVLDGNTGITQADIDQAAALGISVGKYRIIKAAMTLDVDLTYEVAAEMSVRELLTVINEHREALKDFAQDHVRLAYLQLRANAKAAFHYLRVSYIETQANLMLITNPTGFDALLVDSDLDAAALVALYGEYVDAIEAIEIPSSDAYEATIQAKLDADVNIQAKNELLLGYKAEMKALYEEFMGNRQGRTDLKVQAQAIFMNYMTTKAELDLLVEGYVEAENIPFEYLFFYQNGKLEIIILENFMDDYRTIRETYRQLFLEHQVDLAAFEALFMGNLNLQLQATLLQYNQVLNQFRLQMAQINVQARLEIRYEHMVRQQTQQNNG